MKLTAAQIHSIGTSGCGFNSAQLTLLGVTETTRGWLKRLVGVEVTPETFALLGELRGASVARQKELVPDRKEVWRDTYAKHPLPANPTRETIRACRAQFRHLLLCLKAGEKVAAEDHAREIVRLCST